jgi:hypothetical protein
MNAQTAPHSGSDRTLTLLDLFSVVAVIAMASMAYAVWRYGPEGMVPIHIGLSGQVDRWGSRGQVAVMLGIVAALAAGVAALCAFLEHNPVAAEKIGRGGRFTFRFGRAIGLLAPGFASVLMTAAVFGWFPHGPGDVEGMTRWSAVGLSVLMLVIGAFVGRAQPNPFVGVRTYWSLTSRLAWDKSNRLAGRLLFLIGLAGILIAPFAPMPAGMVAITGAILVAAAAAIFESWRVWRLDPERTTRLG